MERLQTIYENAGRPGAAAFRFHARRQGVSITLKEAQYFWNDEVLGKFFQAKLDMMERCLAVRATTAKHKWI